MLLQLHPKCAAKVHKNNHSILLFVVKNEVFNILKQNHQKSPHAFEAQGLIVVLGLFPVVFLLSKLCQ